MPRPAPGLSLIAAAAVSALAAMTAMTAMTAPARADDSATDTTTDDSAGSADDTATADSSDQRARGVHWSIGVGGYLAATGPARTGAVAEIELYPALGQDLDPRSERLYGLARRLPQIGVGLYVRGLDRVPADDTDGGATVDVDDGPARAAITLGVCYEVGAARPTLALSLRAEAGVVLARDPVRADAPAAGGGLHVTVGLIGPIAAGISVTGLVIYAGADTDLALASALTLGLAR